MEEFKKQRLDIIINLHLLNNMCKVTWRLQPLEQT